MSNNKNLISLIYTDFREEIFNEIVEKNNYSQNNIFINDLLRLENKLVLNYDWKNIIQSIDEKSSIKKEYYQITMTKDTDMTFFDKFKIPSENIKFIQGVLKL